MTLILAAIVSFATKAWAWLKAHPTLGYAAAALVVLALAFGAGRYSNPAKVVTRTETHETVKYVDRVVTVERKVAVAQVHRVVVTKYVKLPSGEVERVVTATTDRGTKVATNVDTQSTVHEDAAVAAVTTTTTSRQPDWLISAMGGAAFNGGTTHPFVGVQAQRRIAGPVFIGVFGTAQTDLKGGTAGGTLGVSF